jgi:rhodanese-related sulfurtransferase
MSTKGYLDLPSDVVSKEVASTRLVDVREPHEFSGELGHVAGAELVPLATVEAASAGWDNEQRLILICRSGNRSGKAAALLAAKGFKDLVNMAGGMLQWNALGLPTEK